MRERNLAPPLSKILNAPLIVLVFNQGIFSGGKVKWFTPPQISHSPPPNKNFLLPPYFLPRPLPLLCLHLIVLKLKRKSCTRKQFNCATLTPSGRTANQISVYGRASSDASPLLTVLAGEKGWGYCRYLLLLNLISPL